LANFLRTLMIIMTLWLVGCKPATMSAINQASYEDSDELARSSSSADMNCESAYVAPAEMISATGLLTPESSDYLYQKSPIPMEPFVDIQITGLADDVQAQVRMLSEDETRRQDGNLRSGLNEMAVTFFAEQDETYCIRVSAKNYAVQPSEYVIRVEDGSVFVVENAKLVELVAPLEFQLTSVSQ
jgi:hypothetical protein